LSFPIQAGRGNDGITVELSTRGPVTVHGCNVVDNSGAGVSSDRSTGVTIEQCTIVNSGTLKYGGSGVSLNGGTKNVHVIGNHITNKVSHPGEGGIVAGFNPPPASGDSDGQISNNVVSGFGAGVALGNYSTNFRVQKNDLRLNKTCYINYGVGNKFISNLCP
jgi:hypothetical protein